MSVDAAGNTYGGNGNGGNGEPFRWSYVLPAGIEHLLKPMRACDLVSFEGDLESDLGANFDFDFDEDFEEGAFGEVSWPHIEPKRSLAAA